MALPSRGMCVALLPTGVQSGSEERMEMREKVEVCEVGPRDGLQMIKTVVPTPVKVRWINQLFQAGLRHIEVGSFVPPRLVPQMADTEEVVLAARAIPGLHVIALVPNLKGAQRAHAAGVHKVIVPISVSESHSLANTRKGTFDQINEVAELVRWNKSQERPMRIEAGCSTALGCSMEGVIPLSRLVSVAARLDEAGVDDIALADTVGYGTPQQVRNTIRATRAAVGGKLTKLHLHDTMGMAIANATVGVEEGIRSFDSALAGLGGCPFAPGASGNIVTEDLVFLLESMGFDTGIDLAALIACRDELRAALPEEPLRGAVAVAGIPKTFTLAA